MSLPFPFREDPAPEEWTGSEPSVSIVVRTLNCRAALERCLRAIRSLNYPQGRYEIIVVDGHSWDGTVDIARGYGARVLYDDGKGRNNALNVGIQNALGEYVAFTDADCVVESNWLKRALPYFADGLVGAVGGPNVVPEDGSLLVRALEVVNSFFVREPSTNTAVDFLATCNCIFRADVLRFLYPVPEIGGGEDAILGARARDRGLKLMHVPDLFVRNYTHYVDPVRFLEQSVAYGKHRVQLARYDKRFASRLLWLWGFGPPVLGLAITGLLILRPEAVIAIGILGILVVFPVLARGYGRTVSLRVLCYIPVVACLLAFGYSAGFIREFLSAQPIREGTR